LMGNLGRAGIQTHEMPPILELARYLHGHMGPFLVIGVRAGLAGLRELQTRREDREVSATAHLTYSVPYSCILDGIQIATGCTIGNKRLRFQDSPSLMISFQNKQARTVTVSINAKVIGEFKQQLLKGTFPEEAERLAHRAASIPERELFSIDKG